MPKTKSPQRAALPDAPVPARAPGSRLGDWVVGEAVDADPGAAVFLIADGPLPAGEREVVVEIFPALTHEESRRRFQLFQAQLVGVELPGVAPALAAGLDGNQPYVVRRRIPGETLATLRDGRGAMRPEEAVRMLLPVADALAFAHTRGLIHGEVTSAHLRVDPGAMIFLEGFGSAALRGTGAEEGPTVMDDLAGIAQVLRGLVSGASGVAPPGQAGPTARLAAAMARGPATGSKADLEAILVRAGAWEPYTEIGRPGGRSTPRADHVSAGVLPGYGSLAEFAADLRAWLLARPVQARPASAGELLREWCWGHPVKTALVGAGLLALVAAPAGYFWWRQRDVLSLPGKSFLSDRREFEYAGGVQRAHAALKAGAWDRLDSVLDSMPGGVTTGPELGLLRAWLEVQARDRLATLGAPVVGLRARADGTRVVTWTARGVDLLGARPGTAAEPIKRFGAGPPLAVDFLPDERQLAVGMREGVFLVGTGGEAARVLPRPVGVAGAEQLRVSPDGRWIATVPITEPPPPGVAAKPVNGGDTNDWRVNLLPLAEGGGASSLRLPVGALGPVVSWDWIEPEPGVPRLAIALREGQAGRWDLLRTNYVSSVTRTGEQWTAAAWDAVGERLARLDTAGALELVGFTSGESIWRREGHGSLRPLVAIAADGSRVAATTTAGDVAVYRAADGAVLALLPRRQSEVTALAFLLDGNLVTGTRDGSVWRWEPQQKDRQPGVRFRNRLPAVGMRPCFDPESEWVALPEEWREEEDRFVVQRLARPGDPESLPGQPAGFLGPNRLLVWDRAAGQWDVWSMEPLRRLGSGHLAAGEEWNWAALSADASRLAVRAPGDRLEVYNVRNGERIGRVDERVDAAAVSADGRKLALVLADAVAIWTPDGGGLRRRPRARSMVVAIAPDAQWAAFGDDRGKVRVWHLADDAAEQELATDGSGVTALVFGGGTTLFVGSTEGELQAWQVRTGQVLFQHRLSHPAGWLVMGPEDSGLLSGHAAPSGDEPGGSWWWPVAGSARRLRVDGSGSGEAPGLPKWLEGRAGN